MSEPDAVIENVVEATEEEVQELLGYMQRLFAEREELSRKFDRLTSYVDSPEFRNLPRDEAALYKRQRGHMFNYLTVLDARIARG